jgi:hypothetical protein
VIRNSSQQGEYRLIKTAIAVVYVGIVGMPVRLGRTLLSETRDVGYILVGINAGTRKRRPPAAGESSLYSPEHNGRRGHDARARGLVGKTDGFVVIFTFC